MYLMLFFFFFFNDTATTEIYTLSLHDGSSDLDAQRGVCPRDGQEQLPQRDRRPHDDCSRSGRRCLGRDRVRRDENNRDRKSTRLNSSHVRISYAVFCLKKKKAIGGDPREFGGK